MRKTIWASLPLCILAVSGCLTDDNKKLCTASLEVSFCLTYNGSDSLPADWVYIREASAKVPPISPVRRDTLSREWNPCFAESIGPHRVLVMSKDTVIFQSEWIIVGSKDGCHANPATVDIRR